MLPRPNWRRRSDSSCHRNPPGGPASHSTATPRPPGSAGDHPQGPGAHAGATQWRAGGGTALAWHVAGLLPWGPLLAGCLSGIGVTAALRIFAGPIETPVDLGAGVRASFVPVIAGLAFLLHDPHRQLTGALPAASWLTPAIRVALALPVLALTGAIQLHLAARALATDQRAANQPAAGLPWVALALPNSPPGAHLRSHSPLDWSEPDGTTSPDSPQRPLSWRSSGLSH